MLSSAVEPHDKATNEQGDHQGYISLATELGDLETIYIEQKYLAEASTKPTGDGQFTSALIGRIAGT